MLLVVKPFSVVTVSRVPTHQTPTSVGHVVFPATLVNVSISVADASTSLHLIPDELSDILCASVSRLQHSEAIQTVLTVYFSPKRVAFICAYHYPLYYFPFSPPTKAG